MAISQLAKPRSLADGAEASDGRTGKGFVDLTHASKNGGEIGDEF